MFDKIKKYFIENLKDSKSKIIIVKYDRSITLKNAKKYNKLLHAVGRL